MLKAVKIDTVVTAVQARTCRAVTIASMTTGWVHSIACTGLLMLASSGHAAGGHFDVDDAAVLAPGRCQYEAWFMRAPVASASVWHLGPGCRLGPVEMALNIDRVNTAAGHRDILGPQLKWATDPALGPVSVGLVAVVAFDTTHGGRAALTLYAPLTWNLDEAVALNLNLGVDRDAAGRRTRRQGVSAEWVLNDFLTVLAERVKLGGEWTSRLGSRFTLGDTLSIDLSAARVGPRAARVFAVGLNHEFGREFGR